MDVKELNEAYRALTDDERDTLHSSLSEAIRAHTPHMSWTDFGVRMYLEGRKSLLTAPQYVHELHGSRVEHKLTVRKTYDEATVPVRTCPGCGLQMPA